MKIDASDFELIFKQHYTQLYYFAFDLTADEEVSRDIVSDAFATLWSKRDEVEVKNLHGYLFICVRNKCFNYLQNQKGKQNFMDYCRATFNEEDEQYWQIMEERIHEMDDVIATLPERTRFILEQCYFHQHTYREVAAMLNITTNGVKKHIVKAFAVLREHYRVKKRE